MAIVQQTHSDLPFRIEDKMERKGLTLLDAHGKSVAAIRHQGRTFEELEANAAFIEKACNCHDMLLGAAIAALARLNDPYLGEDDGERQAEEIRMLEIAIAKTEGGNHARS